MGSAHDTLVGAGDCTLPSASQLRAHLTAADLQACATGVSTTTFGALCHGYAHGALPVQRQNCDQALVAYLRRLSPAQLQPYCGGNDGFAERLHRAISVGCTFDDICTAAQTKRYPLARIRRALLRAYLDLPLNDGTAQYARVLAIGARGQAILKQCKKHSTLPIITKPSVARQLPDVLQSALAQDARADELYAFAQPCGIDVAGVHFRKTPYLLPCD